MRVMISIGMMPLVYLIGAFVSLEPNVLEWSEAGRMGLVVVSLFSAVMCYTCPAWYLDK